MREEARHSLRKCFHWSFRFDPFHLRISHVSCATSSMGSVEALLSWSSISCSSGLPGMATVSGTSSSSCSSRTLSKRCPTACSWRASSSNGPLTSSKLRNFFRANSNLLSLHCAHSCLDESDNIGSQIGNRRGLDNANVIGVVVDGSRLVLTNRPSHGALEWAHQPHIARL